MKILILSLILLFPKVLYSKNITVVCTRTSASNSMTGETFNTSSWKDITWHIDTSKKIVRSTNGIKWHSEFTQSEIKWSLCMGEESGGKPMPWSCPRSEDGKTMWVHKGWQNFLNRATLSYTEWINDKAWMPLQYHKGYCRIANKNQL